VQGKGDYENNSEESICQSGLNNHEDDSIVGARIIFSHDLPQLASHGEQAIRYEQGINNSEPHLDAEVNKLDVDITKYGTSARLYNDANRQCCSRHQ
jgi:hypothetical protein